MSDTRSVQRKLGTILLAPGITPRQAMAYIVVSSVLTCLSGFMAIIQPYVFTEQLHILTSEQGRLTGNLSAVQQGALLVFVSLFGALSDRFGRRLFMVLAVVGMTLAILAYPLATAVIHLYLLRFLFGTASTCHTAGSPPMRMDLLDNGSRGRFLALVLVSHAVFNFLISYGVTRLPAWLQQQGVTAADAGRSTFVLAGVLGLIGLVVALLGLPRDRPKDIERISTSEQVLRVGRSMREVIAYARINKRFGIVLLASAVLRADVAVIGTFIALWVVSAGRGEGLETAQALKAFGTLAMIMSATDLIFGVVAGFVADRVNRMKMLIWAVAATAVAFSTTTFVHSVTGLTIIGVVILINLAEAFQVAASQALIGEETPPHLRGSAYGMFALIGTVSVMGISLLAGQLFDKVGYKAPFLLMAGLGAAFVVISLILLGGRIPKHEPAAATPE